MTVTGADISLSATHASRQTYKREESLLVGFVSGDEGFSEDTVRNGRRITRVQEQSEALSDDTLLDQFKRGENLNLPDGTRIEYLSSLRALQAEFFAEVTNVSLSALLPSMVESEAVESIVPSDFSLSAKDRARIELIVTIVEKLTGKRIQVTDLEEFLDRRTVDTQLDPLTPPLPNGSRPKRGNLRPLTGLGFGIPTRNRIQNPRRRLFPPRD